MAPSDGTRMVRVTRGEIESGAVTTRLVLPTTLQPAWPPYRRVSEGIASARRQLPSHAHEREEVLTYLIEGRASYQLEGGPVESLSAGSALLLTAPARSRHSISPAEGASVRWFNLVLDLSGAFDAPARLQATDSTPGRRLVDEVEVRPLTGPRGPMTAGSGLESEVLAFLTESTTFRKVGPGRRAIVYAWAGEGSVDEHAVRAGETALIEGVPGVAVRGMEGFQAVFTSVPKEPAG